MKPKKKNSKEKNKRMREKHFFDSFNHFTNTTNFFLSFINLNKKQMGERKYRKNLNVEKQDRKKLCNCSIRL